MEIVEIKITKLKPFKNNTKSHPVEQVEMIKNSIVEFGFKNPIIVDKKTMEVIAWHGRLLAAKALGMESVPCLMVDDLTTEQIRAYRMLDNRISDYWAYDLESVQRELAEIGNFELWLESLDKLFEDVDYWGADVKKAIESKEEDLEDMETRTFQVHKDQKTRIEIAIELAKLKGDFKSTSNNNVAWNCLHRICEFYIQNNS